MPVSVIMSDNHAIHEKWTIDIVTKLPKGKGEVIDGAGHFLSIDQEDIVNSKVIVILK